VVVSKPGRPVSRELLLEHRRLWERKPVLPRVYQPWFDSLLAQVPVGGRALEVGAGPGFLVEYARKTRSDVRFQAMDVLETPWNDVVGDALRLPIKTASVDAMVGLDFLHHLADPAAFFREAARVLVDGGRLSVVEPWVTALSFPIYRWMHQEGCSLRLDPWDPFGAAATGQKDAFQGDAAVVAGLVRSTAPERWAGMGFAPPRAQALNGFAYLLSLGFKPRSLLPSSWAGALLAFDRVAAPLAPALGMRVLVCWDRLPTGSIRAGRAHPAESDP
jgi:SAM-dependent methyltransferase